jgi:hypothetical protein
MGLLKQTEGMTTMNERLTPETDADTPWHSNGETKDEWFARQREKYAILERERDEAQTKLTYVHRWIERNHPDGFIDSQSHLQNLERVTDHIHDKLDERVRERDEAEQQLKTMRGVMARLCRAVSRRMMPDDPTPEDRMELREAFDAASSILHNDQDQTTAKKKP